MGTVMLPATDKVGNEAIAAPRAPFSTRRTPATPSVSARSPWPRRTRPRRSACTTEAQRASPPSSSRRSSAPTCSPFNRCGTRPQIPGVGDVEPWHLHADAFASIDHRCEPIQVHDGDMLRPGSERVGDRDANRLGVQAGDLRRHRLSLPRHRERQVERDAEESGPPPVLSGADHGDQRVVRAGHLQDEQLGGARLAHVVVRVAWVRSCGVAEPRDAIRAGGHEGDARDQGRGSATPHGRAPRDPGRGRHRYNPAFSM